MFLMRVPARISDRWIACIMSVSISSICPLHLVARYSMVLVVLTCRVKSQEQEGNAATDSLAPCCGCPSIISVAEDCATNLTSIAAARSVVTDKHRGARGTSSARRAARGRVPSVAHHAETMKGTNAYALNLFIETQRTHREQTSMHDDSCWGKTWLPGQRTDG